jgi:hypothetical protein
MAELRSLNIVGPSGQLDNVRFEGNGRRLAGTDDPHYDAQQLRELSETGHQTLVLDRAHHGLAIMGDADASARIPLRLVAAIRSYLSEQAC